MKKFIILSLFIIFATSSFCSDASAATRSNRKSSYVYAETQLAINRYKRGNYIGCLQGMQNVVARDPSSDVAHYYLAIAYVKIGNKASAIKEYKKVIALNKNSLLVAYANQGLEVLSMSPDQVKAKKAIKEINKDLKQFNNAMQTQNSKEVKNELERQNLNRVKNIINTGNDVKSKDLKQFDDYTPGRRLNQNVTPSDEEIGHAVKVLAKAGINPLSQFNGMNGMSDPSTLGMSMLMGNNSNSSNNMMNMLPLLLSGKNGNGSSENAEAIQAMMMNSMLQNSFDVSDNNKNNW